MKRVHPNLNLAAAFVAMAVLLSAVGCKYQQTAIAANPFLGPNRVPPPATRTLLPGQAQPYYQGDPLPVSQTGAAQPAAVAQASAEAEMPSAEGNLAWTSPSGAQQQSKTGPTLSTAPPALPANPPTRSAAVASNEPSVAIPEDGNSLRFAIPQPELAEPQPFTPNNPVALTSTPAPNAVQQPKLQLPAPPSSRDIVQTTYTEPAMTNSQTPAPSPWRSPQITQPNVTPLVATPPNYAPQPFVAQPVGQSLAINVPPSLPPYYAMPTVTGANTMDVRLREVPSPPMPRIRIPGPSTSVPMVGSADGFRSRTSMR